MNSAPTITDLVYLRREDSRHGSIRQKWEPGGRGSLTLVVSWSQVLVTVFLEVAQVQGWLSELLSFSPGKEYVLQVATFKKTVAKA